MKKLLIASTSTVYGSKYLEYLQEEMKDFFTNIETILFIPYARPGGISHEAYTDIAQKGFAPIEKKIVGIHSFSDAAGALRQAQAIFVGGGNTFLLVKQLYDFNLMDTLKEVVLKGTPYMGTSAGSNITGISMQTTNDMPIVYPPSFVTLGLLPFNINPHYLDPIPDLKHMGETRETRIKEFHKQNTIPVIGLREGSWLRMQNNEISLKGNLTARVFQAEKEPYEHTPGLFSLT